MSGARGWLEIAADVLAQVRPEDGRAILTRELAACVDDRFDEADADAARTIQRLVAGLDAHLDTLALADRARAADADAPPLTARERVILRLLAEGSTAEAIARRLGISPRTVHKHLEHLYRKLGASDRLSAVLAAQRHGLCR